MFDKWQGIQAGAKYPTIEEYIKDWDRISPEAREALVKMDDKNLDSDFDMGGFTMTYHELMCVTIYREANMLGQLALWRRLLGYPALKYD